MALLYYQNLGASHPEIALQKTYSGLQDFFHYLKRAKEHLERTRPTLPWKRAGFPVRLRRPTGSQAIAAATWRKQLTAFLREQRSLDDALVLTLEPRGKAQQSLVIDVWDFDAENGVLLLDSELKEAAQGWLGTRKSPRQHSVEAEALPRDQTDIRLRGTWVEMVEPVGREVEQSVLDAFFDEDLKEVYELPFRTAAGAGEDAESTGDEDGADGAEADVSDGARHNAARASYPEDRKITIVDRLPDEHVLCLARLPRTRTLCLRPNTHVIDCQSRAVQRLMNQPDRAHLPLVNLFQRVDVPIWPSLQPTEVEQWYALTKLEYPGTSEQRDFVTRALATPDFMLLEGPPGSGKTTAIIELILQLIRQGKRVLLTASTHVAVDNVIKDLKDERKPWCNEVLLCRIGDEKRVRSEKVRAYCLNRLSRTEHQRLIESLEQLRVRSASQNSMLRELKSQRGEELVRRLLLDTVQVVAGTTIGILQHPALRAAREQKTTPSPIFDVMILDEASKTPFAEFLVPALLARRWVIVGDRRQLSPYIEEKWVQTNLEAAWPERTLGEYGLTPSELGQVCLDVFDSGSATHHRALIVGSENEGLRTAYLQQSAARLPQAIRTNLGDERHTAVTLALSQVVVGVPDALSRNQADLPLDVGILRAPPGAAPLLARRIAATGRPSPASAQDAKRTWGSEIAWRLIREYELRLLPELADDELGAVPFERLAKERQELLPAADILPGATREIGFLLESVEAVRRVALPSVLESLQQGFGRSLRQKIDTALAQGLPLPVLMPRLIRLSYQHRMHPNISTFPHQHIYRREALFDSTDMAGRRAWGYEPGKLRARFVHVDAEELGRPPTNPAEADEVIAQVERFARWAENHPAPTEDGTWTVAVLTFYRGQEREIRRRLRVLSGQGHKYEFQLRTRGRTTVHIQLGTVDSFQGHEADLVLLSMVRTRAEGFLNSPNRLNVGLTRARYQLLVLGNRAFFLGQERDKHKRRRRVSPLLVRLAGQLPYDIALAGKEHH